MLGRTCICRHLAGRRRFRSHSRQVRTTPAMTAICYNFEHFNEVHRHSSLRMRSAREFRRQQAVRVRLEPSVDQTHYCE